MAPYVSENNSGGAITYPKLDYKISLFRVVLYARIPDSTLSKGYRDVAIRFRDENGQLLEDMAWLMEHYNDEYYNAEDVRIRNYYGYYDISYTYDTNCKLSRLLFKVNSGSVTKYVYGLGLIGEEKAGCFKTYHFDYRGSTVAITDSDCFITDTSFRSINRS